MDDEGNEEPAEYNVAFTIPEEQTNGPIAWRFTVYNTAKKTFTIRYPEFPYTKVMRKMGRQ